MLGVLPDIDLFLCPRFLPFLAVVSSMLFFAVDVPIIPLVAHIWMSPLFGAIVLFHMILVIFWLSLQSKESDT
jgi:hypothetical protein